LFQNSILLVKQSKELEMVTFTNFCSFFLSSSNEEFKSVCR